MNLFLKYFYNLSETGYSFERALIPELKRFAATRNAPDVRVLDFGCAHKPYLPLFAEFKGDYIGIDVYPGRVVDFIYGGRDIPIKDSCVDLVFATSVFEHVEDLDYAMGEIARILRPGGEVISVTPFMGHTHGTPFDFNRPTRFAWQAYGKKHFGQGAQVEVRTVDGRWNCVTCMVCGQINIALLDFMRLLKRGGTSQRSLIDGVSPETHGSSGMKSAYFLLKLNPVNFVLGTISWIISLIPIKRRAEGEITSGFLFHVVKSST